MRDTEALLKPKKKFSFASRATTSAKALTAAAITVENASTTDRWSLSSYDPAGSYILADKADETILLSADELNAAAMEGQRPQLLMRECSSVILSA